MKNKICLSICLVALAGMLVACGKNADNGASGTNEDQEKENMSAEDNEDLLYEQMECSEEFKDVFDSLYIVDVHAFTGEIKSKEEFVERYGEPQQMVKDDLIYFNVEGLGDEYCVHVRFNPNGCDYWLSTVEGDDAFDYHKDKEWCLANGSSFDASFLDKYFVDGEFNNDYNISKLDYTEFCKLMSSPGTVPEFYTHMIVGTDEVQVEWYCEERDTLLGVCFNKETGAFVSMGYVEFSVNYEEEIYEDYEDDIYEDASFVDDSF